ncbi:hypothetical protein QQF64_010250 [Cirrhinus molitorella]|uniref:Uncharacterized protein n=1 Tax=Cirrhinus molitorella TaxID=172907 RepID=A0ABR3M3H4_9TELE
MSERPAYDYYGMPERAGGGSVSIATWLLRGQGLRKGKADVRFWSLTLGKGEKSGRRLPKIYTFSELLFYFSLIGSNLQLSRQSKADHTADYLHLGLTSSGREYVGE